MRHEIYDIAIVGAGPAGIMAAIRAGELGKKVILIERNSSIGKKILMTGKGRCNITNIAPIERFVEKFGEQGEFLRSAFFAFSNEDLIAFFRSNGLELISERQGRVFPITNKARHVVEVLRDCLGKNNVELLYSMRVKALKKISELFELEVLDSKKIMAKKVIIATGGLSYKMTGSTGDGFRISRKFGHTVIPLRPALVPLRTKEVWVKEVQGLTLKNIIITFRWEKGKLVSKIGELLFTHFGVSGPLVLDLSATITALLEEHREICLLVDLKPGLDEERLEKRLISEFTEKGTSKLKNILENLMPKRLVPPFIRLSDIDSEHRGSEVTQKERRSIIKILKAIPLTITGSLSLRRAMVTSGGISTKEIDPKTMESKVIHGLYFAGEIINGEAPSGGYNLQQAFSTGFLAGEKAACSLETQAV